MAILTGDGINEGFFIKKSLAILPGQRKLAVITRWPFYQGGSKAGSTVINTKSFSLMLRFVQLALHKMYCQTLLQ